MPCLFLYYKKQTQNVFKLAATKASAANSSHFMYERLGFGMKVVEETLRRQCAFAMQKNSSYCFLSSL